ncbi:MAG: diphthamide synthesis protein [Candidatus Pacearchaeota archaeon]
MKILFIPTKSKLKLNKSNILGISKKLPKNIAIAYSVQYEEIAKEIKEIFSKSHNITKFTQILGCSKPQVPKNTQAILLISDGKFHAVSLRLETRLPIYLLDNNNLIQISEQEIQNLEKKRKSSYLKFLNANKIGILVSTKPGQENLKKAIQFKNQQKTKNSYLFIGNEINSSEFENFPQIQSWVNTACPRLDMNANVVNLEKII